MLTRWLLSVAILPILLTSSTQAATSPAGLCGNDRTTPCLAEDKDQDGYASGVDCDDLDFSVFPAVTTANGCPEAQTRKCGGDGQFSSCTATAVCEAAPGSTCKYIDCGAGNDSSGTGTFENPYRSFRRLSSYTLPSDRPAGWYDLRPGDYVYIKGSGACSEFSTPSVSSPNRALLTLTSSGVANKPITIKRYPGSTAVLSPPFNRSFQGKAIRLDTASYIKLEDLEVSGGYSAPLYFTDTANIEVSRVYCHDIPGNNNDNVACINAAVPSNHYIHHNRFADVYDADNPKGENVSLIAYFSGGDNRFEYNRFFYSQSPTYGGPIAGSCLKYKHPSTFGQLTILGNQFSNCWNSAISNSARGARISRNVFLNPASYGDAVFYHCGNLGSDKAGCADGVIENNTVVNARAYSQRLSVDSNLGTTIFRKNIVVANSNNFNGENGFFRIEHYGSDSDFSNYRSQNALVSENNVYFNRGSAELLFDLFGESSSGSSGGMFDFSDWQSLGYDRSSTKADPNLDSIFAPRSAPFSGAGWSAGTATAPQSPNGVTGSIR